MTRRNMRRALFGVAILTLPLPFYLGDVELSPLLRLAFLSSLFGAVALVEGGATTGLLGALGAVQTLLGAALLWAGAALLARLIDALHTPSLRTALLASILGCLVIGSFFEIYTTSLSSTRPRSNVLHLFE